MDTADSPYGYWGIVNERVPSHGLMPVANHIRACLDMIHLGYFGDMQGVCEYFLATPAIDAFMGREYSTRWLDYKQRQKTRTNGGETA